MCDRRENMPYLKLHDHIVELVISPTADELTHVVLTYRMGRAGPVSKHTTRFADL